MKTTNKAPLWDTHDLAVSEIELRETLSSLESEWVIGKLKAKRGTLHAEYVGERRIVVEYDASVVTSTEIVSFLYFFCGLTATGRRSTSGCRAFPAPVRSSV